MQSDDLYTVTQWKRRGDWVITPVLPTHHIGHHGHYEDKVQMPPDDLYTLIQWQERGDWVMTPVLLTHLIGQHPHNGGQGSDAAWWPVPTHTMTKMRRLSDHTCPSDSPYWASWPLWGQGSDAAWWPVHSHTMTRERRLSDDTCPSDSPYWAASPQWGTRFRCCLMTCTHSHNDENEEIEWPHLSFWLIISGSRATMGTKFRCYWWLVHTHIVTKERSLTTCPPSDSPYQAAWPLWGQGSDAASKGSL